MLVRCIVWVLFGLLLSLIPLVIVAMMDWEPASKIAGFFRILSNEELLAVAFTLGGAAAVDALVNSGGRFRAVKVFVGGSTLMLTFFGVGAYVLIKAHLTHFPAETVVTMVQDVYVATVVGSFLCEVLSEA